MLNATLLYGLSRMPVRLGLRPVDSTPGECFAYHNTIPRSLLGALGRIEPTYSSEWHHIAPLLEELLTGRVRAPAEAGVRSCDDNQLAQLERWYDEALAGEVLSFCDSAQIVQRFVERLIRGEPAGAWNTICGAVVGGPRIATQVEIWSVQEGHTSSVWRVSVKMPHIADDVVFCVNVGRDRDGSAELVATSNELRRLRQRDARLIPPIYAVDEICIDRPMGAGHGKLCAGVTASAWLDNAVPLQVVPSRSSPVGSFVAVERFIQVFEAEAVYHRIYGRTLSEVQTCAVRATALDFLLRNTVFDKVAETARMPSLELNEGDLVWTGDSVRVVGLSEPMPAQPLGMWVLSLFTLSACTEPRRLLWVEPVEVMSRLRDFLVCAGRSAPSYVRCLKAALAARSRARGEIARELWSNLDQAIALCANEIGKRAG